MQNRGSALSTTLGSHMRAWPPVEISTRRQRRVPFTVSRCSQVPEAVDRSICVMFPPAVVARPRPVYTMLFPPAVAITTPAVPSRAERFWMMRGAVVSDGATLQAPTGSDRLTTHESELPDAVQLAV